MVKMPNATLKHRSLLIRLSLHAFVTGFVMRIKSILPTSIKLWLKPRSDQARFVIGLLSNYWYDGRRFSKWSAAGGVKSRDNFRALITMDYHRIEKALALRDPRPGFGAWLIPRLMNNIRRYRQAHGSDETVRIATNALRAFGEFNASFGVAQPEVDGFLNERCDENAIACGGVEDTSKDEILSASQHDLAAFFASRHSIRQFADEEVDMAVIELAVQMAMYTPSVCNRQTCKVHVFCRAEDKAKVLSYQNGNRGFGEQASKVLIVTSDLQGFASIGERNQCWIDGGMFSMSLVYALHSLGLGTCCLNWSVEKETDQGLRAAAGIGESEAVMMMIAVGHLPHQLRVAQSPRKDLSEVLLVR